MSRVLILVEGQTERDFVLDVLTDYFRPKGIYVTGKVVVTKRSPGRAEFQGGIRSFEQVERDVRLLLNDSDAKLVTTMIDFYGLAGKDFPGWNTKPIGTPYQQVDHVETAIRSKIANLRFRPYLALHEFEAMLFADPEVIAQVVFEDKPAQLRQISEQLTAAKNQFNSPEEINHDRPPSKRILEVIPRYDKVLFGSLILLEIGLERIRAACPHFDGWLKQIEALAEAD